RAMMERRRRDSSFAYGRAASAASWARRSRAAATNFIARVICWVFFTERMRRRKSRSVAMGRLLRRRCEAFLEGVHSLLDFSLDRIVERLFLEDALQSSRLAGFDELEKFFFEAANVRNGNTV